MALAAGPDAARERERQVLAELGDRVRVPVIEEGGPSLVDCNICMVVVWWY